MHRFITKFYILCLLTLTSTSFVRAQDKDSIAMYGKIDNVSVIANRIKHINEASVGARVTYINSAIIKANRTRSLAELLTDNTSLYIKSIGTGALSTASFRGASSSQTKVFWNGINITPPMSGTFDFSQIPVFFTDDISLYYGSSHVKNGTGAIGGSVNLFTDAGFADGVSGKAIAEYGSYGTSTVGGQINVGNNKYSFKTRLYRQHSDNDYTYLNNIQNNTPFKEKRQDASYSQFSVMQEMYAKISNDLQLTGIAWYYDNKRKLPPPLGIVNRSHEKEHEYNFRGYMGMDLTKNKHILHLKTAWLYYKQNYDVTYDGRLYDPKGNINSSKTFQAIADYYYTPVKSLMLNSTLTYSHDWVDVSSYIDIDSAKYTIGDVQYEIPTVDLPFNGKRNVLSCQGSATWTPLNWLVLNGQYMFEQNDKHSVSTWQTGFVLNLFKKELQLKASMAYNYRFPSLNDLYWRPGGNPNVKPEHGYSYDASVSYKKKLKEYLYVNIELSSYLMYIDNWILWLPKDGNQWVWTPQNKRNVLSNGIELYSNLNYKRDNFGLKLSGNFSWSQSRTNKKQHVDDGSYMKQIPYVPRLKWNVKADMEYNRLFASWQLTYIGKRFITTDKEYSTNAYSVHNLVVGYKYKFHNGMTLTPQFRVDNIFNTYYESTQYYPMPLRNCLFSLSFEF